ncbi:membrane protein [Chryseobacterium sp. FH1]|uniref:membrane protein n=1 Tax=Chryseobacterium sp. FH1 TaxID=1233951 RepID=UPI0004E44FB1|nr:membrane protein [Chryseobacterium sp. FH1]KFC18449.1 membrane protein [Chryseobacterium sp. FH1]
MKRIFVLSSLVAGYFLNAQSIGNSPYGVYGIGDVKYDNTVETNAMGGISTAYIWDFNNSFNFRNPAANTNLELTTIKVEGTNENNYYKSDFNNINSTKHSTYVSNISIAFPISKTVKFGMGFQPYSAKSYNIGSVSQLNDENVEVRNFRGEGSVNTVQAALSYQITPAFALGLRSNFYFGKLTDIEEVTFIPAAELISGYSTSYRVKAFNFTLGTTYQKKMANDHKLTVGATYTIGNSGNMRSIYTNSTYYKLVGEEKYYENIIDQQTTIDKKFLPQEASLGLGYGKDTKWFFGTQVDYKKGENFNYLGSTLAYQDSYKYSVGGWWLPNFNDFRSYFSRVIYRYGAYYEKGNLQINGTNINRMALTAGVTLPFQKSQINRMNSMDIGIEVGKRGTLDNNLIRQNFINLRIGINFADKWFNKRLYN